MFPLSEMTLLCWFCFCLLVHVVCTAPIDSLYMEETLKLSLRAAGRARPNPLVGCVIVNSTSGEIVGRGWHHEAGGPHAEVWALRDCSSLFVECEPKDLTAYVTLEPCNHFGRTPPCTKALCAAGVSRVVVALLDTDPRVAGQGIEFLRSRGTSVDLLQLQASPESDRIIELCARGNAPFLYRAKFGRPFLQRLVLSPSTWLSSSRTDVAPDWLSERSEFWARVCALQDTFVIDAAVTASGLRSRRKDSASGAMQALRDLAWHLHSTLARHLRLVIFVYETDLQAIAGVDLAGAWLATVAEKCRGDTDRQPDELVFVLLREGQRSSPMEEEDAVAPMSVRGLWCMENRGDDSVELLLREWCSTRLRSNGVSLVTMTPSPRSAESDDQEVVTLQSLSNEVRPAASSDESHEEGPAVDAKLLWRRVTGRHMVALRPRLLPLQRLLLSPRGKDQE